MKSKFELLFRLFKKARLTLIIGLFIVSTAKAQLPTAQQIADQLEIGINLGNTLEAICGEDAWGAGHTSQQLIDSIKAAGFNTIRIPVAWFCHSDTVNNIIDEDWIARVKEVVDYCYNAGLYVVMNAHWDKGWLENRVNQANQAEVNQRQHAYWTQIAGYFKDYDERLMFAGANEPNVHDATAMSVLMTYHQTFIDAVRATGGNNSSRTLIIQGPATDIDETNKLMNTLPIDVINDRLMVEIHYYTPYQFCLMSKDESWGKMFYYWGKQNHSKTDAGRNASWGEEKDVEKLFGVMKTKFIDKGIPVILGEYGAYKRKLNPPLEQALHDASVEYYLRYVTKSVIEKGIIPYYWDTPGGMFERSTGAVRDRGVLNAIMQVESDSIATGFKSTKEGNIKMFPNPFRNEINLSIGNYNDISKIAIYSLMGCLAETIEKPAITNYMQIGSSLQNGIYIVKVYGEDETISYKIFKNIKI
ncbi:MAG TPA: cellulase family glycosylhydrolase [Prolixibacteraceae bacterium]|nr:cellulase family glycosylhydrolase [Prolixibacteraceae bacterium]